MQLKKAQTSIARYIMLVALMIAAFVIIWIILNNILSRTLV